MVYVSWWRWYTSDDAKTNFKCDICNDCYENEIYLQTDFGLKLLSEENMFINRPKIWFDDNNSNILYIPSKLMGQ